MEYKCEYILPRLFAVMRHEGYKDEDGKVTVGHLMELAKLSDEQILRIRNMGSSGLAAVRQKQIEFKDKPHSVTLESKPFYYNGVPEKRKKCLL